MQIFASVSTFDYFSMIMRNLGVFDIYCGRLIGRLSQSGDLFSFDNGHTLM